MQSMEQIYTEHWQLVYRYLLSLTRSADLAEELTQETFYQAVCSVHRFEGRSKVTTWLCGIAKNVYLTWQRKTAAQSIQLQPTDAESVEEWVFARAERKEILKHIYAMGTDMKDVLYLRLLGDLSFREIGDILGKSENWARVTYHRGKEKLRKELEAHGM